MMAKVRGDTNTLDLLGWQPPAIVERFDEEKVRSSSLRARISRAVAETLRDCNYGRDEIAEMMSAWLGEDVTEHMINAYASQAREDHTISFQRLLALVHVTGDTRVLQMGAELFGHTVINDKYLEWVEVGMKADRRDEARRQQEEIDRDYEASLRTARRRADR